jgi:chromate transporter
MTALIALGVSFAAIGVFAFGGGYAMIPLIQQAILAHGWVPANEFADIVAISQMTPGPIAINAATYIGARTAGIPGSMASTLGVVLPSFVISISLARFLRSFREHPVVDGVLSGIRPVTIGMIASAVVFFAELSVFSGETFVFGVAVHPGAAFIFCAILVGSTRFKLHPIPALVISAVSGAVLL